MKKLLKYTLRVALGFVVFIALYVAWALVFPLIPVNAAPATCTADDCIPIYILTNGKHTDVVVPVVTTCKDWRRDVPFANVPSHDTTCQFVAFGWGDKGFFIEIPTWNDLTFRIAFRAAFALSAAAMHVTFYHTLTESDTCKKMVISPDDYRRLVAFIASSFKVDGKGCFIPVITNANYGVNDSFYEARGRYNLFYTCNSWANNALKACHQKACLWTLTDRGIFRHYR